jgi:penicillin-binding protein 1C
MGRNNDLIVHERNKWLQKFANEKIFSKKEIEDALSEPLTAMRGTVPHYLPHLSYKLKRGGNDIIRTNIIMNTQMKTEKLMEDYVRTLKLKTSGMQQSLWSTTKLIMITYIGSSDFS